MFEGYKAGKPVTAVLDSNQNFLNADRVFWEESLDFNIFFICRNAVECCEQLFWPFGCSPTVFVCCISWKIYTEPFAHNIGCCHRTKLQNWIKMRWGSSIRHCNLIFACVFQISFFCGCRHLIGSDTGWHTPTASPLTLHIMYNLIAPRSNWCRCQIERLWNPYHDRSSTSAPLKTSGELQTVLITAPVERQSP